MCTHMHVCVHMCVLLLHLQDLVHSRSEISIYWMNWQIQARKDRVGRIKAKNETVFGWGKKERWPPNFSAIKGRKLNMKHSVDSQLNSAHCSIPPPLLQSLAITILGPCIWGSLFLAILTTTMAVNFPYITNPGNSFWFNLKQVTPLPGCN